jgi:hypothetical protein
VEVLLVGGRQQHAPHPGAVRGDDLLAMRVTVTVTLVMALNHNTAVCARMVFG